MTQLLGGVGGGVVLNEDGLFFSFVLRVFYLLGFISKRGVPLVHFCRLVGSGPFWHCYC